MKAFIFPGQGSQFVGMCKELYENHKIAKDVFDEVDEALNLKLSGIIFHGPEELLTLTSNTQPALMACSIALLRLLENVSGKKFADLCAASAGHSLGQYSALCASGSLNLSQTAKVLKARGEAMNESCPQGEGAMAACMNIELSELQEIINNARSFGECAIANDNAIGQIVISGAAAAVDKAIQQIKDLGKKAIKLKVSAPFHSPMMNKAADIMQHYLETSNVIFNEPTRPILDNSTLEYIPSKDAIKDLLVRQITHTVRWRETGDFFNANNFTEVVEIGPGSVLTKINQRANYSFRSCALSSYEDILTYAGQL